MKLGELLSLRADLQKRLQQVQKLLLENATHQEGTDPIVDPTALLNQYRELSEQHEDVVRRVNHANMRTRIHFKPEIMTLSDAVVRRERLARHAGMLRELAAAAMPERSRWLRTELKHVPAFDVASVMSAADSLSREHRELDTAIQRMNWETEVID